MDPMLQWPDRHIVLLLHHAPTAAPPPDCPHMKVALQNPEAHSALVAQATPSGFKLPLPPPPMAVQVPARQFQL